MKIKAKCLNCGKEFETDSSYIIVIRNNYMFLRENLCCHKYRSFSKTNVYRKKDILDKPDVNYNDVNSSDYQYWKDLIGNGQ